MGTFWVAVQFDCFDEEKEKMVERIKRRLKDLGWVTVFPRTTRGVAHSYPWKCRRCGKEAEWSIYECDDVGLPICPDCRCKMTLIRYEV